MSPPTFIGRYQTTALQNQFTANLRELTGNEDLDVGILSARLADLDNDGAADDLYGTALLRVGSRFKSFAFAMREDGASRFMENNGENLDISRDLRRLSCMESRPWLCPATLERATRQIRGARVSALQFDTSRAGLELVFHLSGGRLGVVNSLELFAGAN